MVCDTDSLHKPWILSCAFLLGSLLFYNSRNTQGKDRITPSWIPLEERWLQWKLCMQNGKTQFLFLQDFFCTLFWKTKQNRTHPYRIATWLKLQMSSGGHLVQPSCSCRDTYLEQAAEIHVQRGLLENLQAQRLHNPSGQQLLSSPCPEMTPKSIVSTGMRYENTHISEEG